MRHCGGDLLFPHLTLMDPEWGAKMPLFIMAPGAVATFSGSDLCHGTTEHDDVQTRPSEVAWRMSLSPFRRSSDACRNAGARVKLYKFQVLGVYEYPVTNAAMVPHAAVLVQALDESFVGSLILADGQMGLGMLFPSLSLP